LGIGGTLCANKRRADDTGAGGWLAYPLRGTTQVRLRCPGADCGAAFLDIRDGVLEVREVRAMRKFVLAVAGLSIWYYLLYVLLQAAHVDRLVWFLYVAYMPIGIALRCMEKD
jgi:hypothetical protein